MADTNDVEACYGCWNVAAGCCIIMKKPSSLHSFNGCWQAESCVDAAYVELLLSLTLQKC